MPGRIPLWWITPLLRVSVAAETEKFILLGTDFVVEANTTFYFNSAGSFGYTPLSMDYADYDTFMTKAHCMKWDIRWA